MWLVVVGGAGLCRHILKMATFSEQVAIVTGGAQGLGEAVSKMLASNGCSVVIFDYDAEKGAETASRVGAKFIKVKKSSRTHLDISFDF